jgi:polysaccharide export outer membrane protein
MRGASGVSAAWMQRQALRWMVVAAALLAGGESRCIAAPPPDVQGPAAMPPGKAGSGPDYIIGPGDTLQIFVWRNPDLSTQIPVRPDGKISTPLVENMMAVGKTTSQLARDIEAALQTYVRSPTVNVIVVSALSAMSQVTVVGAAANPKALPYRDGLRVMDAVLAVGGLTQFAAGNRAKIVREQDGKSQEIRVRLKNLLEKGDLSQNLLLKPGDVLVIPESFL